jgi:hypothetical protein
MMKMNDDDDGGGGGGGGYGLMGTPPARCRVPVLLSSWNLFHRIYKVNVWVTNP